MALNDKEFFAILFVLLWCYASSFVCQKLDNQLQQLCLNIHGGYNFTARFQSLNGVSYQDRVYSKVLHLQRVLKTCSNVSELMICSSVIPKCVEGRRSPVLPCREVCEQFVDHCGGKLQETNLWVLFASMCQVLPDMKGDAGECIKPKGFERQEKVKKFAISLNCSTQTIPACIHGNYSQLPEDIKTKLIKHVGQNEPLLKSGCLEKLKRYSCYGQTTPCYIHGRHPYRPCRRFCELLKNECNREISLFNLSFPLCDELTEGDRVGELCRMDSWPVPWPNITINRKEVQKPWKTCYCDTCGKMERSCQTNGSCFIQSQLNGYGLTYTQQTCLHPGKQRDFICNNTQDYLYAKCCEQDYCNKDLQWMSQTSTTTGKPTSIPTTAAIVNVTSTGKPTSKPTTAAIVNVTSTGKPTSNPTTAAIVNVTSTVKSTSNPARNNLTAKTVTTPPSILATTQNSSSTSTGHDGIYIMTIKTTMASLLAITLNH